MQINLPHVALKILEESKRRRTKRGVDDGCGCLPQNKKMCPTMSMSTGGPGTKMINSCRTE
jgi:hypothetical protein